MRKITESTFISLDGVTTDPRAWATPYFSEHSQQAALKELNDSDGMLMGRGTYEYFADVLPVQTGPYADALNSIRKYVFSATLERADWNNTTIVRGDAVAAISELKRQDGRDLIMYGHGRLSQALLNHGLLDEVSYAIHPVLLGHDQPRDRDRPAPQLQLAASTPLPTGVVVLTYKTGQP